MLGGEAMDEQQERNLAAAAWALSGPFGPIIPMDIYMTKGRDSSFVAFHSLQAALSYAFLLVAGLGFGVVLLVLTTIEIVTHGVPEADAAPPAMIGVAGGLGAATLGLIYVALVIAGFVFAARARKGQLAKYPLVNRIAAGILAREPKEE